MEFVAHRSLKQKSVLACLTLAETADQLFVCFWQFACCCGFRTFVLRYPARDGRVIVSLDQKGVTAWQCVSEVGEVCFAASGRGLMFR